MKRDYNKFLRQSYKKINILKSLLMQKGNKERSYAFLLDLFSELKNAKRDVSSLAKKKDIDPFIILNRGLSSLMPSFLLKRTFVAGRFYELPIPINERHAYFMSANWLRKGAFEKKNNTQTIAVLLAKEILIAEQRKGTASKFLQKYIDIALDQKPFSRFIRKKKKFTSKKQYKVLPYGVKKRLSRRWHKINITKSRLGRLRTVKYRLKLQRTKYKK